MTPCKRKILTKAQLEELKRLKRGPQHTFGASRVRVQNNLVLAGYARYLDIDSKPLVGVTDQLGFGHLTELCEITEAGDAYLKANAAAPSRDPNKGVRMIAALEQLEVGECEEPVIGRPHRVSTPDWLQSRVVLHLIADLVDPDVADKGLPEQDRRNLANNIRAVARTPPSRNNY